MPRSPRITLAFLTIFALAAVIGCSDKKSTNPPFVSGPTFNFTFPATGVSHTLAFITVGSWNYRCVPHSGASMTGTVNVEATTGLDSVVVNVGAGGAFVFDPATVTIKSGGTVRWVNVSTRTDHTVTR